ncbi:MAG: RagB/SusD family nutrient uptake outer membrane protein [Ferruginibacter sp.]
MKKIIKNNFAKILLLATIPVGFYACSKSFLDVSPQGVLDEATLSTEKGVNKILLSAYAMLDGYDGGLGIGGEWGSGGSNFVFGSMAGGEANRGSTPGDQSPNMTNAIRHDYAPGNGALNDKWKAFYEGVKRTNTTLEVLAKVANISATSKNNLAGQARFLRAWYHFQARITFGKVPYIDEKVDQDLANGVIAGVSNETEIFPQIVADAKFAYENLPALQDAKARVNKWAAGALYGKILMFTKDFATAKTVLTDVVNNGATPLGVKYDLNPNYDDNFNVSFENSSESVFAFQSSSQDNAGANNANWGDNLNTPATIGGAGFFCPTYYFTNNFKTDAAGLPLANPQNTVVLDPVGTNPVTGGAPGYTQYSGNVDTRLDWTVGRNGVPFHDWGTYLTSWQRDITAGPFAGKKIMIRQSQVGAVHDASIWFSSGGTSLNINFLRFSDVLLLLAEAEIEAGSLPNAFALINRVRIRAQNSRVVSFPVTYGVPVTKPYITVFATQAAARSAVRLERMLELGMEGQRFYDLVRWASATTELTDFYNYESAIKYQQFGDLAPKPAYTGGPKQDYYAIPQQQIDLSHGLIKP